MINLIQVGESHLCYIYQVVGAETEEEKILVDNKHRFFSSYASISAIKKRHNNDLKNLWIDDIGQGESFHETFREAELWCLLWYNRDLIATLGQKIDTINYYSDDLYRSSNEMLHQQI